MQAAVESGGVTTLTTARTSGDAVKVEGMTEGGLIHTFFEFCVWAGDLVGTLLGGFMAPPMIKRLMTTSGTNLRRQKTTPSNKIQNFTVLFIEPRIITRITTKQEPENKRPQY